MNLLRKAENKGMDKSIAANTNFQSKFEELD